MLASFGLHEEQSRRVISSNAKDISVLLNGLLMLKNNQLNAFVLSLIDINGREKFITELSELTENNTSIVKKAFNNFIKVHKSENKLLTGAEAVALLMKKSGIEYVFAYPGTSELALCDSILRTPGLVLINGRGDKESAFMAAGGSCLKSNKAVALLHGARGLTNAAGAIADAYRNEVGTVFFVGLPSTSSSPFLPPHGEKNLLKGIGTFVKQTYEVQEKVSNSDSPKQLKKKIASFTATITKGITSTTHPPVGPVIIGLPQDIMEQYWVPMDNILRTNIKYRTPKKISKDLLTKVTRIIKEKKNPVILIDDYLFKDDGAKEALVKFAASVKAPILQIQYLRGPMLFERLSAEQNPFFAGSYTLDNQYHQTLMKKTDILILLEDRNAYTRILGVLPRCQKISITSNPDMTRKNAYLCKNDLLVSGKISEIITSIAKSLTNKNSNKKLLEYCQKAREETKVKVKTDKKYKFMRQDIGEVLANIFKKVKNPLLVDDSQMFGGLLFESYDKFPSNLRVFGDHGAFIGGGISLAAGLARCNQNNCTIFCTIGDQSFINAIQGLVSVAQEKTKIIYIVCNNGRSVSLLKQILSQDKYAFNEGKNTFLYNVPNLDYAKVAKIIGLTTYKVIFGLENSNNRDVKKKFQNTLEDAISFNGPSLIELILLSNSSAWEGIWITKGNEAIKIPTQK